MGGHGGLNILPQKRWNVYNFDNREKVRKDEEAAAKEEQIQREEARKRDAQSRLEVLRNVRGLAPLKRPSPEAEKGKDAAPSAPASTSAVKKIAEPEEPKTGHINLFEGIKIFDPIELPKKDDKAGEEEEDHRRKKMRKEAAATARASAKDAAARAGDPDEEKYRLGYGVAGKGVKLPWYVENKRKYEDSVRREEGAGGCRGEEEAKTKSGKKSLKELREERLKRERVEKERERALFMKQSQRSGGFSRR
ncbi:hypothetical protein Bca4012_014374 [Brassica carinata]